MFQFSIASYSFHRALAAGKQDIFSYITDSKKLGAAQLDPWNGHLAAIGEEDAVIRAGRDPGNARFSSISDEYVTRVRAAADEAGLPFVCLAIDGEVINCSTMYHWSGTMIKILPDLGSGAGISLADLAIFLESGPLPTPLRVITD